MTPSLIIPVGIPGCGKSTFAETFFNRPSDAIASTDRIREALGDVNDQSRNDQVFDLFHASIEEDLSDGMRVFADATNLTLKARVKLREIAMAVGVDTHLLIFANADQAVMRNLRRDRVVPEEAMLRMLENYEIFKLNLPYERYNYKSITEIRST